MLGSKSWSELMADMERIESRAEEQEKKRILFGTGEPDGLGVIHAREGMNMEEKVTKYFCDKHGKEFALTESDQPQPGGNMMKWISVKDRLPEDSMSFCSKCLVVIRTHGGPLPKGYYEYIEFATFMSAHEPDSELFDDGNTAYWEFDGNEQSIPFEVTHWMPLPELPGEEEK